MSPMRRASAPQSRHDVIFHRVIFAPKGEVDPKDVEAVTDWVSAHRPHLTHEATANVVGGLLATGLGRATGSVGIKNRHGDAQHGLTLGVDITFRHDDAWLAKYAHRKSATNTPDADIWREVARALEER